MSRLLRIFAAYMVLEALYHLCRLLIFVMEHGGWWGAYFKIMRNPKVQHHWAEFVYGDMNYGYGETTHWVDEGEIPAIGAVR